MITISNISASQARSYYYEKDPIFSDNSAWFGKTAELFGLEQGSAVGTPEFAALLAGLDPRNGEQLIPDGANGNHRAGVDLTLSAPKGFSTLALVSGDENLLKVFDAAVTKTLEYAEENLAQVRMSIDGQKVRVDSHNFAIATFQHSLSRQHDPILHIHAVAPSVSQREHDGKFVAVENRALYENRHLLDQYFKNELAAGAKELGYAVVTNEKGDFDIAGVPSEVIDMFSKRRQQVLEKAEELRESGKTEGLHDAAVREQANLQSRDRKTYVDEVTLRERWDNELAGRGTSREEILQKAVESGREAVKYRSEGMTAEDYVRTAAMALTENESTFSKADILKTAGKLSIGEVRVTELESVFSDMLESRAFIQLEGKEGGFKGVYTTREMYKIEKELVSMIKNGQGRAEALMTPAEAEKAIDAYIIRQQENNPEFGMTNSQYKAVFDVLKNQSTIQVIQGSAGVGKSHALGTLRQVLSIYAEKDIDLVGLSYTGKAAGELQKSSGIESMTLARFLGDSRETAGGDDIPRKEKIYIVDEASMMGSRDAYKLFQRAEKDGSKVILVGDVKQLLSIQSGAIFSDVQQNNIIDVTMMTEVLRQKTQEMKDYVADISEKRIDSAFRKLEQHGRLHQYADRGELIEAITSEYVNRDDWRDTLVLTGTNDARRELNQSIRQELQAQEKIGQEDITLSVKIPKNINTVEKHFAQSYQEGDFVFSSQAGGGLQAGSQLKVIGVNQEQHVLTLEDDKGNLKLFDVKAHGSKISAYTEERDFVIAEGEKILFTKNDRKMGVQNGLIGIVEQVDREGNLTVSTDNGDRIFFNTKQFNYIEHADAVSVHKSQGMTTDNVIFHVDSTNESMNTTNSLYVAISRGKFSASLFTDNIDEAREAMKTEAVKISTLSYDKKLEELAVQDRHQEKTEMVPDTGRIFDTSSDMKPEHDESSRKVTEHEEREKHVVDSHGKEHELSL